MKADLIICGKIFTSEKEKYAKAFAAKDGKIIYVGSREGAMKYKGDATVVKEYKAGVILPGFAEGHAHVSSTIELVVGPLVEADSIEKAVEIIAQFDKEHPGTEAIYGGGFDPGLFGPEGPKASMIDAVVSDRPVIISDEGHHSVWVNTKALEISGITKDTPDPDNGHICKDPKTGEPTGFIQELAIALINPAMPELSQEKYEEAILYYQNIGLSYGITNTFEPMLSHTKDELIRFDAYGALEEKGKLKISFRVAPTLNPGEDEDTFFDALDRLHKRFEGHDKMQVNTVKFFMDGVVDGHTALLREPYQMEPFDCGSVMFEQEELNGHVTRALREGYRVHIHAIGDAAIDEALNAYEVAQKAVPEREHRNAITHLQVCAPDQPKRMKDLNVVAVVNPYWHYETPLYEPLELPFLGKERAEHMYYLKSFLDAGVHMSQASDFPVTVPPDTMFCLHMMVNRFDPKTSKVPYDAEQCIGIEDAIRVMTIGGAYENDLETQKGSIAVGKDADFVCLDRDVLTVPKDTIYQTHVAETWIQGECVYVNQEIRNL